MSLLIPAPRPLVVDRRDPTLYMNDNDTGNVISGFDFYGSRTKGGAHGLREMNTTELLQFYKWIRHLYTRNQTVTLSYVGSGGNLGIMRDTRRQAGTATNHASSFRTAGQTPNITNVNVDWSKIQVNYDTTVPMPNILNYGCDSPPLTLGSYSPNRKHMRKFPMLLLGELVAEALAEIGGNKSNLTHPDLVIGRNGGYAIIRKDFTVPATHDEAGTLTSMGRAFEDTIANKNAYTSGGIPETLDQPLAVTDANKWDLYSMDKDPAFAPTPPPNMVYTDAIGGIHEWSLAGMQQFFEPYVQHIAANGYNSAGAGKLHWYIQDNINGVNSGTGGSAVPLDAGSGEVENERLVGSSASGYTQGPSQPASGNNYRTQEFPNGTPQLQNTYSLRSYTEPV